MARQFFNKRTHELEQIFAQSNSDVHVLTLLIDELNHRKTHRAIRLKERVAKALSLRKDDSAADSTIESATENFPSDSGPTFTIEEGERTDHGLKHDHLSADENTRPFDIETRPEIYSLVEPRGARGKPEKYSFTLRRDITLNKNASLLDIYIEALTAHITELRKRGAGRTFIQLNDGQREMLDGGQVGYRFEYTDEANVFEGARVEINVGVTGP